MIGQIINDAQIFYFLMKEQKIKRLANFRRIGY